MGLIVAGVSHHTAPIDVRERLVVPQHEMRSELDALCDASGAREAVLLSTCNRTELYAVEGGGNALESAWERFSERLGTDARVYGQSWREREAAAHLFRVAAGMDSMILGESQIHAQVRDAWELSRSSAHAVLNRLFQTALHVSARVREQTAIGRGAASVSSAAVQLAKKIFGSLQGRRAMVLGAGETAELALECLLSEGVRVAVVANRTFEKATALAARHGAEALRYDECWERLTDMDVLVCSTAAPRAVVERRHLEPAVRERGDRPLCVLDIALPRDVSPDVRALDNVFLYDMDDLHGVVSASLESRRAELPQAEAVIREEADRFWAWVGGLSAVPTLTTLRTRLDSMREERLAELLQQLRHLPPDDRQAIEHFSKALMNKFLHEPSVRLRSAAADGRGLKMVDALRYLFALSGEPPKESRESLPGEDG